MLLMLNFAAMKKAILLLMWSMVLLVADVAAQCAMCTKTASQLGEKSALGLNQGILYLMGMPFVIVGVIAYRWWKNQPKENTD